MRFLPIGANFVVARSNGRTPTIAHDKKSLVFPRALRSEGPGMWWQRLISSYKDWRARRKANAKKRYDARIRRIVAKEWAREQRQNNRRERKPQWK